METPEAGVDEKVKLLNSNVEKSNRATQHCKPFCPSGKLRERR
jgi:hypothetical protein